MDLIAINGSPRVHGNTATLIKHALKGAQSKGANTECINLYHLNYKGCRGCFSCKRDGPGYARCAIHDELEPILDKITEADALILGTPIYYGSATGEVRSFLERLLFPRKSWDTWSSQVDKKIPVGVIFTMGATQDQMKLMLYEPHLRSIEQNIRDIFGKCESIYITNTAHVEDYSKYRMKYVDSVGKLQRKKEVFPIDCENVYSMGARFALDSEIRK
jgi:multimeric flavodoxin WrbA